MRREKKEETFRPINNMLVIEKILEKWIYQQLLEFIANNNALCDFEFGFRKNFNCETALQLLLNKWNSGLDSVDSVVVVFLDLQKAFQTIDRNILIKKLSEIGISENVSLGLRITLITGN